MSRTNIFRLALLGVVGLALAGCGGGGGSSTSTTPVVVPSLESNFGTAFNTDFFASPNSEPVVPMAGDIIALSLTTEPMALH